jgi:DNA repair photolyase
MKWSNIKIAKQDGETIEAQAPVIISASRSTDIPAFYSDWLFNRIKAGYVKWKNPFNKVTMNVAFNKVRLFVFWSKNPKPMLQYLDFFDEKGYNYYFQFTLNDYDKEKLEPGVPNAQARIETFQQLSERIGKEKVIWRFDPIILTAHLGIDEILRKVENIGNQLQNHTLKLVLSFADISNYKKVQNNLRNNSIPYQECNERNMNEFASGLQFLNKNWNFELATCAEQISLAKFGIKHNKCVDDDLMCRLFSKDNELMDFLGVKIVPADLSNPNPVVTKTRNNKDKGQRSFCGCITSKDIGAYNTCPHGCEYCYANVSRQIALKNWKYHKQNPYSETIISEHEKLHQPIL